MTPSGLPCTCSPWIVLSHCRSDTIQTGVVCLWYAWSPFSEGGPDLRSDPIRFLQFPSMALLHIGKRLENTGFTVCRVGVDTRLFEAKLAERSCILKKIKFNKDLFSYNDLGLEKIRSIQHPNVQTIYGVWVVSGICSSELWVATEYPSALSVRQCMEKMTSNTPPSIGLVAHVVKGLLQAMERCQREG